MIARKAIVTDIIDRIQSPSSTLSTGQNTIQGVLALDGDIAPVPLGKTEKQRAVLESILVKCRDETAIILDAVNQIRENEKPFKSLKDVPTILMQQARVKVFGHQDKDRAEASKANRKAVRSQTEKVESQKDSTKPYRPWSQERLFQNRGRLVNKRIQNKFTIPSFLAEALQEKVLTNPEYYGVCPLPSETQCTIKPEQRLGWIKSQKAKLREAELQRDE